MSERKNEYETKGRIIEIEKAASVLHERLMELEMMLFRLFEKLKEEGKL